MKILGYIVKLTFKENFFFMEYVPNRVGLMSQDTHKHDKPSESIC